MRLKNKRKSKTIGKTPKILVEIQKESQEKTIVDKKYESNRVESKRDDALNILDIFGLDRKDLLLCGAMILIFSVIGIINIGTFNTPITGWVSSHANESFYMDLKNEYNIDHIYIMQGTHPKLDLRIYSGSPNNWTSLYNASSENSFLSWYDIPLNTASRYIKFVANSSKVDINEIVVYTGNYKKIPILKDNVVCEQSNGSDNNDSSNNPGNCGELYNLVDEQYKVEDPPSYMSGTMFDEIYFARTAYQHIVREAPFEYTHPPLGKLLIAAGILVFGLNTIGWRIVPFVFGIAMIPIMYIFGKRMFKNRFGAFASAFLISFDSMHFVLARIGITDVILSTFIVLMFYFFFIYYDGDLFKKGWKRANLPLFLSGVFFGFAVSVKWTALYGAFAVIVLFLLLKREELNKAQRNSLFKLSLVSPILIMLASYVAVSFIIYYLSYVPIMGIPGEGSGLEMILRYQQNMYIYHTTLTATHPFSSSWWSWIFMIKPVWIYGFSNTFDNTVSNIVALGNPAIWWTAIPFIFFVILRWIRKKDRTARFIAVAFLLQLVPYIFIGRITFIYHMFPNIAFIILASVYGLNIIWHREDKWRYMAIVYLVAVLISFIYFYPITAAYPISRQFNDAHKLLSSWIF
jgi:dolichyl-phosphate-mannose-protein mannosyltransferase